MGVGESVDVPRLPRPRVDNSGVVVGEAQEVGDPLAQRLLVPPAELDGDAPIAEVPLGVAGVGAAQGDVGEEVLHLVLLEGRQDVLGPAARRVGVAVAEHDAELEVRVDPAAERGHAGRGDHLVVDGLELGLLQVLDLVRGDPQVVEGLVGDEVDLVDHDPVPHPAGQTAHDRLAEAHEEADGLPAVPAGVGGGEVEGHLVVGQREDRFHAVGPDLVDEALVEGQALLIGLGVVAVGEDAGPVDRGAEGVHPGPGQEPQVLGVGVVEVDALALGVAALGVLHVEAHPVRRHLLVRAPLRRQVAPVEIDVGQAPALAPLPPGALGLVGGDGPAPQEVGWEGGGGVQRVSHGSWPPVLGCGRRGCGRRAGVCA